MPAPAADDPWRVRRRLSRRPPLAERDRPAPAGSARAALECGYLAALLENPLLGRRAQLSQFWLTAGFGIHSHHRLGAGQAVAHPRTVFEHQLHPVRAHHFPDLAAKEFLGM